MYLSGVMGLVAQSVKTTFVRHYPAPGMTGGLASLAAPNGLLYITGQFDYGSPDCVAWLSALTPCGEPLWTALYDPNGEKSGGLSLAYVEGNRLAVGLGDPPILLLLDAMTGNVLWSVQANDADEYAAGLAVDTALDRILWTISWNTGDGKVLVVDYNGNFVWSKRYSLVNANFGKEAFHQILVLPDTTYVFCGVTSIPLGTFTFRYDIWVVRVTSQGTVLWSRQMGSPNWDEGGLFPYARVDCSLSPDQRSIYVVGYTRTPAYTIGGGPQDVLMVKLDTAGNLIWAKTYGSSGQREVPKRVRTFPDGRVAVLGDGFTTSNTANNYAFLLITDSNGQMLALRKYLYGTETDAVGLDIKQDILLMSMYSTFPTTGEDAILVQADHTGYVPCGMDTLVWGMQDITLILNVSTSLPGVNSGPTIFSIPTGRQTVNLSDSFLCIACTVLDTPKITLFPRDSICWGDTLRVVFSVDTAFKGCLVKFLDSVLVFRDTFSSDTFSPGMHTVLVRALCAQDSVQTRDTFWVLPPPQVQWVGDTAVCYGDTGTLSVLVNGGIPPFTFSWSGTAWLSCVICDTTRWVAGDSTAEVQVMVTDRLGCRDTLSITLNVLPLPVFDLPDTSVCWHDSLWLGVPVGVAWQWRPTEVVDCDTCSGVWLTASENVLVQATVWSAEGCAWTDSFWVRSQEGPYTAIVYCPDTVWFGARVELRGETEGESWWWSTPDGVMVSLPDELTLVVQAPVVVGERDTFFFWATDAQGCLQGDTCVILAYQEEVPCTESVWLPNTFTPNGDGKK